MRNFYRFFKRDTWKKTQPSSGTMVPAQKANFLLPTEDLVELEYISMKTGETPAHLVRRAIVLFCLAWRENQKGAVLLLRYQNGETKKVTGVFD